MTAAPNQPRDALAPGQLVGFIAASAACLTLLFSAQDVMRRRAIGAPVNWAHTFALNALDWLVWALLVPGIIVIGQRIRLDGDGRRGWRIAAWAIAAIAFCAVQSAITGLVIRFTSPEFFGMGALGIGGLPIGAYFWTWGLNTSSLNLLMFGMTVGAFHAALYYRDLRARQLRETDLRGRLARAELNTLRAQLQPHFLFNALHTVSSLMVTDIPTAQRVVASLGDLLRTTLDHTARQEIPLRDELAFVERYLDVQRARFRNRLAVDIKVDDEILDALVPSLVLQPLAENAIRHGIEPRADGGTLWIAAERGGDTLRLTVRDDGGAHDSAATNGGGVGLANLQARLRQLYGAAHTFRAERDDRGGFVVALSLPLHTNTTPDGAAPERP